MKTYLLNIVFSILSLTALSQPHLATKVASTQESEEYLKAWQKDLYDVGIRLEKDSLHISTESKKIMQDSVYRTLIYPATYRWSTAVELIKQMELKKAFWFFIKLYGDSSNRQLVIQSLLPFDKVMDMDKVLISTFYTYALLDPKICSFKNNRVLITHPDILEKEFSQVKEIVAHIKAYRKD